MNESVTHFVKAQNHPLEEEINILRQNVLSANKLLSENIKWNGPNYTVNGEDRITMRMNPPNQLQLIFHRGAKVLKQPEEKLIKENTNLLVWKTNDRAVLTFKNREAIEKNKVALTVIINDWLRATT